MAIQVATPHKEASVKSMQPMALAKLKGILGTALFGAVIACAGCSSHTYHLEAQEYAHAITAELIHAGVCKDESSCNAQQTLLWSAGGWKAGPLRGGGVNLQVYHVADERVADALVEQCRLVHAKYPNVPLSIVIQSNAHIDNLHPGTQVVIRKLTL